MGAGPLDGAEAERWLAGLEPFGVSLGLERMRLLCRELGDPQRRYATVHIVGTNGKTSVARMIEGLAGAGGLAAGASVSPHLRSWRERVSLAGRPPSTAVFAAAATHVKQAVRRVEAGEEWPTGERITQFEAATAVAFQVLADAGVELAAVEAGLGGRLDASNVIDSRLTVLTTVGRDHTEFLGELEEEIAGEKLAVLRPKTALVLGPVSEKVRELARIQTTEKAARLIEISAAAADSDSTPGAPDPAGKGLGVQSGGQRLLGRFRRIDLEIARLAAVFLLEDLGRRSEAKMLRQDAEFVMRVAARVSIPGRLELCGGDPPLILDVAHNVQGAEALAEALPEVAADRPIVACLALLADKDGAGIAGALASALDHAVCAELPAKLLVGSGRPGAKTYAATDLVQECGIHGLPAEARPEPVAAIARALELARERGGVALIAGSHHLVALVDDRHLCDY